jgi:2,3-bisphosphoglycerate-dependent phosphoglycerate mutase
MIELTFLRHGRSSGDDLGVHEGRFDTELTAVGRAQVARLIARWEREKRRFDCIVSSPLARARTTAELIAAALSAPLEIDPLWLEMDNGPLAGLPFAEAEARYPWPTFRNPYEPFFESGESDWAIHTRAAHAVERLVQRGGPGRTLVVAHGGILNAALRHVVGAPPPVNRQGVHFALADAGYACATYDPERHQWWLTELAPGEESEGPAAGS